MKNNITIFFKNSENEPPCMSISLNRKDVWDIVHKIHPDRTLEYIQTYVTRDEYTETVGGKVFCEVISSLYKTLLNNKINSSIEKLL